MPLPFDPPDEHEAEIPTPNFGQDRDAPASSFPHLEQNLLVPPLITRRRQRLPPLSDLANPSVDLDLVSRPPSGRRPTVHR